MTKKASNCQLSSEIRGLILVEFKKRQSANPSYSLRALARDLSLNQAFLSRVLRGQRRLSSATAYQIAMALGIPGEQIERLVSQNQKNNKANKIAEDQLAIISDWYPFAVLELIHTTGFQPDVRFVANRLGLEIEQAEFAIRKLIAAKILEIQADGSWTLNHNQNNWVANDFTSMVRRRLQKQILAKAQEKIDLLTPTERENLSMTVAVNSEALPEIRQRIREFNESLRVYINSFENRDAVFQFAFAAFPLTVMSDETTPKGGAA